MTISCTKYFLYRLLILILMKFEDNFFEQNWICSIICIDDYLFRIHFFPSITLTINCTKCISFYLSPWDLLYKVHFFPSIISVLRTGLSQHRGEHLDITFLDITFFHATKWKLLHWHLLILCTQEKLVNKKETILGIFDVVNLFLGEQTQIRLAEHYAVMLPVKKIWHMKL